MENLTDHNIKKAVLSFLKSHYKHRVRAGETIAKTDMEGEGGIIADGYLQFSRAGEASFLATFEATSFESREELFFTPENDKLFWDSLAWSAIFSTIFLAALHATKFYPVQEFKLIPTLAILIILTVIFFYAYKFLFTTFSISRYRYIYAIEQFKKYYADEQWIAFGEDVFPNQDDKYFKELKRQSLLLGIGLIIVNRNLSCRFVATPSLKNVTMKHRATVRFSGSGTNSEQAPNFLNTFRGTILYWLNPNRTVELLRFRKVPIHQFTVVAICVILVATILVFEWINGPVNIITDTVAYNQKLAEKAKNSKAERPFYIIDTPTEPGEFEVQKEESEKEIEKLLLNRTPTDIIISDARKEALIYYDCARFANYTGKYYIVQDTILFSFEETVKRIRKLKQYGMDATAIWRGCFRGYGTGYLIYFDEIYQDTSATRAELEASYLKTFFSSATIDSRALVTTIDIKATD